MRRLATLALLLASCSGNPAKGADLLTEVREYQEGLRWRRYEDAARHRPPPEREAFLDERDKVNKELRIDDYEVTRVKLANGHEAAEVQVKYTWHLDSVGVVHETVVQESWARRGKMWLMVGEEHKSGEKLPAP